MSSVVMPLPTLAAPRPRKRTWFALFLLTVGAILGGVPGWRMVFASWMVFCWILLAGVFLSSMVGAACHAVARAWGKVGIELGQAFYVALAAVTLPLMFELPAWVDVVASGAHLRAEADVAARAGNLRMAATNIRDELNGYSGTIYDPSGESGKPLQQRSPAWHGSASALLDRECVDIRHLVGPYYHWSDDCGPF